MKTMKKAVWALGMMLTAMVMVVFTSCSDEFGETYETRQALPGPDPEKEYTPIYDWDLNCVPQESRFDHTADAKTSLYTKENMSEPVKVFKKTLKSSAVISAEPDSVRVGVDDPDPTQVSVSYDRQSSSMSEHDQARIVLSDQRILKVDFKAEKAQKEYFNGEYYEYPHDSLLNARYLYRRRTALTKAASQYVVGIFLDKYYVETKTAAYVGNSAVSDVDLDTLVVGAITVVLDDNDTEVKKTGFGEKVINETQQKDSVVITKTWKDGHSERMVFNTILNRWLKNIARREVDVNSFDGQSAGSSFSRVEGPESLVRSDAYWRIYGREVTITKMVSVDNHSEEVRYTYYQERAEFNYEGISHSFGYVTWNIHNFSDNFTIAPISEKSGSDQLNYKNEIQTYYLDYVQMSNEEIAFFKKAVEIIGYSVVNAKREDYPTYTYVYLEKVANYSDGTSKKVGEYSAKMPITVVPKTNWVYRTDSYGTYVANDFSLTQSGKTASSAEKFFFYNRYAYLFGNVVSGIGEKNEGEAIVPNDIVFKDGDVEHKFANTSLVVTKKAENTRKSGSEAGVDTYAYTCTAGVTFGASQEVSLPGTILVDARSHEHGKVNEVLFTTTENEGRNSYLSVCVIVFEDGFRSIGMTGNGDTDFSFTMSSRTDGINSAVWNGSWIPANAQDLPGEGCMTWFNESGKDIRSYSYVKGNRNGWNNGNNTVIDPRRKGEISEDGYSVTFYLNGNKGKTLNF